MVELTNGGACRWYLRPDGVTSRIFRFVEVKNSVEWCEEWEVHSPTFDRPAMESARADVSGIGSLIRPRAASWSCFDCALVKPS